MSVDRFRILSVIVALVTAACSTSAEPAEPVTSSGVAPSTTSAPTTVTPTTTVTVTTLPPAVQALSDTVESWAVDNALGAVGVGVSTPSGEVFTVMGSRDGTEWPAASLFEVGSLTKTVVAATVVSLVGSGVLDLDEPIAVWLPEFPGADSITLRQLLGHTAGLRDGNTEPNPSDLLRLTQPVTPDELIAEAGNLVASIPGVAHSYSNAGYWVVGAVVQAATGEPIEAVIRRQVLEPLGMMDTYLAWSEELDSGLVPGEVALGPDTEPLVLGPEPLAGVITAAWSAGGIVSTAPDMATFYGALFEGDLVPDDLVADLQAPSAGSGYGLGIDVRRAGSLEAWGHNGAVPGYTSSAVLQGDPSGYAVVVLTNKLVVTADGLEPDTQAFAEALLQEVVELGL